jgi:hypothetical protein
MIQQEEKRNGEWGRGKGKGEGAKGKGEWVKGNDKADAFPSSLLLPLYPFPFTRLRLSVFRFSCRSCGESLR